MKTATKTEMMMTTTVPEGKGRAAMSDDPEEGANGGGGAAAVYKSTTGWSTKMQKSELIGLARALDRNGNLRDVQRSQTINTSRHATISTIHNLRTVPHLHRPLQRTRPRFRQMQLQDHTAPR